MPFRIELSEQGSVAETLRAAELALALDTVAGATIQCDFNSGPWRHLLSGQQQLHLRRLTQAARQSRHVDENYCPSGVTPLWLRPARILPTYPPKSTWLVTTGGPKHSLPELLEAWAGVVQIVTPGAPADGLRAAACLALAIGPEFLCSQPPADSGILIVGCGDPSADRRMLFWLRKACMDPLTLFDPYTQHAQTTLASNVTRAEIASPAERAALYRSCRYVISGQTSQCLDDHFVCEAVATGALSLAGYQSRRPSGATWSAFSVEEAWQTRPQRAPEGLGQFVFMSAKEQAAAIDKLINAPATGEPFFVSKRCTQYLEIASYRYDGAQIALIDCGREAICSDSFIDEIAKSKYQSIYVDISRNALLLSQIFTIFLTRQFAGGPTSMPHIHGIDNAEEINCKIGAQLKLSEACRLDVIHLSCPLTQVLSTRRRIRSMLKGLSVKPMPAIPSLKLAKKPRFLFNYSLLKDTTNLSTRMLGAPVATDSVFQGLIREAQDQFTSNWIRQVRSRKSYGRVYYYPKAPTEAKDGEEIDLPRVCAGLRGDAFDLMFTSGILMTQLLYARRLWAKRCVPMVTLLHSLHAVVAQLEALPQLLFGCSLKSDLFISPTECGKVAYTNLLDEASEAIFRRTQKKFCLQGSVEVIAYGIDTSWYQNLNKSACRQMLHLPHERCIILCLGRFDRQEKYDLLPVLLALHKMVHAGDNPLLILSGGNVTFNYPHELRQAISHLKLGDYVEIREELDAAHKSYIYSASDFFVSPSDNIQETYGLTIIEAMAAGLPVVASRWNGYREIVVDDVTGFLIPTRWTEIPIDLIGELLVSESITGYGHRDLHESVAIDIDALTAKMRLLYGNHQLRAQMGQAGMRHAQTNFDVRRQSRKMIGALCDRVQLARQETWPALDMDNMPYIDNVFRRFRHYTDDLIDPTAILHLTAMAKDEALLRLVLQTVELGDIHETHKVHRLVQRLLKGPASIASLADIGIDPIRALRCLKYGIVRVEP